MGAEKLRKIGSRVATRRKLDAGSSCTGRSEKVWDFPSAIADESTSTFRDVVTGRFTSRGRGFIALHMYVGEGRVSEKELAVIKKKKKKEKGGTRARLREQFEIAIFILPVVITETTVERAAKI